MLAQTTEIALGTDFTAALAANGRGPGDEEAAFLVPVDRVHAAGVARHAPVHLVPRPDAVVRVEAGSRRAVPSAARAEFQDLPRNSDFVKAGKIATRPAIAKCPTLDFLYSFETKCVRTP